MATLENARAGTAPAGLGNFPQAFTHVGLINAALSLAEREAHQKGSAGEHQSLREVGHEEIVTEAHP